MGDPVTMAIVGGSIGAMSNSKDPLKGALLGAAGGYGGATLMGAGGLTAGAGSGLTGAGASNAANTMFANAAGVNSVAAGQSANLLAPSAINFSKGIGSSIYQAPMLGGGPTTGMVPSSLATPPGFLEQIGNYAQQNPNLTRMGLESAQQMMQQPQAQFAPAGQIQRGGIQDVQISSGLPQVPRVSLI
jgi:hypothetical protein